MVGQKHGTREEEVVELMEEPKRQPSGTLSRRVARHPWRTALTALLVVFIILALVLGLYFGLRGSHSSSSAAPTAPSSPVSPTSSSSPSSPTVSATPGTPIATLVATPSADSFPPIQGAFVSYAVEFIFFPAFAGNNSSPNTFSDNLLNNIGDITGTKPYVRVGGNTADLAIYDADLPVATSESWTITPTSMRPYNVKIGPSFFEGYNSFPGSRFIHGLNLKNATLSAAGWNSLLNVVPVACSALESSKLLWWEYGNEPDVYPRPLSTWNDESYVRDWQNGTAAIKQALQSSCPDMAADDAYGYVGPSLLGTNQLQPKQLFTDGLNDQGTVKEYTQHFYMGDAGSESVTLQSTLMNHTAITSRLARIATAIASLNSPSLTNPTDTQSPIPFTLDEANSLLSGTQAPVNTLNVFGAALWSMDFLLWCATIGLSRVHMQQGSGFLYNSWQPVANAGMKVQTSPPYYGNVAVAAFLGNITASVPRVVSIPLDGLNGTEKDLASAYAAYIDAGDVGAMKLARIAVLNLHAYNATVASNDGDAFTQRNSILSRDVRAEMLPNKAARLTRKFTLALPSALGVADGTQVSVQRLVADGSDVKDGISWDGYSYAYELNSGLPVLLTNVTIGEKVTVQSGMVTVGVRDSEAVVLSFPTGG
ncbi:hypothetical protein MMC25_001601 [Agyrium rufum]|nr:hypothetical protein [Agyrium rufum]